jgi:hypothetical protein
MIRPGKPVYRYVFQRLAEGMLFNSSAHMSLLNGLSRTDRIFQATQDIASNEKIIANAESTLKTCEEELMTLKEIGLESSWWRRSATSRRAAYLADKMLAAEKKIEALVKRNMDLKKVLSKGG